MKKRHLILDATDILRKTRRIAYQILEDNYEQDELVLVGIKSRGAIFAQKLKDILEDISTTKISLFDLKLDKTNPIAHPIELSARNEDLENKVVIIVDDVANTGRTVFYALKTMMNVPMRRLRVAVLVDRKHKFYPICSDYVGLSLSTTMQEHISVELAEVEAVYLE